MDDNRILLRMCKMSGYEMQYINEAFAEEWVVPLGPNVSGFEKDLEAFLGNTNTWWHFHRVHPPCISGFLTSG